MEQAVIRYAEWMQAKLEKNAHKACPRMNPGGVGVRGWDDCPFNWLMKRCEEEIQEAREAMLKYQTGEGSLEDVLNELADIGNFPMMAHDNLSRPAGEVRDGMPRKTVL